MIVLFVLAAGAAFTFTATQHALALVVAFVALGFLLRAGFAEEPDDQRLALGAHRYPGGDL